MDFEVRFWGVRGSIACPSPDRMVFGGNTSCVELRIGARRVVLDAGTGIRALGGSLLKEGVGEATLLLTHLHWDHICGFPFFAPIYRPDFSLGVIAGSWSELDLRQALSRQMESPFFPVPLDALRARLTFENVAAGGSFDLGDGIRVRTVALNHPDGATGYRVEAAGRSVCYVTDTEHDPARPDSGVLGLIEGADLVIYDSTYTDDEFPRHVGWGHSTMEEGIRLCRAAGADRLALFHHDPGRDDSAMARIERRAQERWAGAFAAREGMTVRLDGVPAEVGNP